MRVLVFWGLYWVTLFWETIRCPVRSKCNTEQGDHGRKPHFSCGSVLYTIVENSTSPYLSSLHFARKGNIQIQVEGLAKICGDLFSLLWGAAKCDGRLH